MPGRVILRFPLPPETTDAGLYVPQTSQQRPEFAEVYSVGEPTDEKERMCANFFRECQKFGLRVAVSFESGVPYWKSNYDAARWGWLKPLRSYQLTAPAAVLAVDIEESEAKVADLQNFLAAEMAEAN
jgi:hypothetical protein